MENDILDTSLAGKVQLDITDAIAGKGRRFANFLIDIIVFYVFVFTTSFIVASLNANLANSLVTVLDHPVLSRLYGALLLFIYYYGMEWAMKGKTIGKFFTNTRTVMADGSPLTSTAILKRSASRIVPFDAFSFLGQKSNGWHDKWSNTAVVHLGVMENIPADHAAETADAGNSTPLVE